MTGACGGGYTDFSGNMGIVGTPVIDFTTNTMYVVSGSVTLSLRQKGSTGNIITLNLAQDVGNGVYTVKVINAAGKIPANKIFVRR